MAYDNPGSCNECGEKTTQNVIAYDEYVPCEMNTKCIVCGFEDYWAYGIYESSSEMKGKCKKYSFNKKLEEI